MKRAAFLSMKFVEGWCIYDSLLVEPLKQRGWLVDTVNWHDHDTIDFTQYAVLVVRSCWDYQDHLDEFVAALRTIKQKAPNLIIENSLECLIWNSRKTYAKDLARGGCPIIPTVFIEELSVASNRNNGSAGGTTSANDLQELRAEFDKILVAAFERYDEVLLKPVVGASSFGAYRLTREEFAAGRAPKASKDGGKEQMEYRFVFREEDAVLQLRDGRLTKLAPEDEARRHKSDTSKCVYFASKADFLFSILRANSFEYVLQPFIKSITSFGEYSVFYFGGTASHAVHKLPKAGDFRVQEEYEAVHRRVPLCDVPRAVLMAGQRLFASGVIPASSSSPASQTATALLPLYCRVDLVAVPSDVMRRAQGWAVVAPASETETNSNNDDDKQGSAATTTTTEQSGEELNVAIIEAELIEPSLYFNLCPEGIDAFVAEFVKRFGEAKCEK